jgi:hypothetical protein
MKIIIAASTSAEVNEQGSEILKSLADSVRTSLLSGPKAAAKLVGAIETAEKKRNNSSILHMYVARPRSDFVIFPFSTSFHSAICAFQYNVIILGCRRR